MVFGNPAEFAIDGDITERSGNWVFGRVVFIASGEVIGNPGDAADVLGCRSWMKKFLARSPPPVDSGLESMSPDEFFRVVFDPVMVRGAQPARYPDAFRRFSISNLGMSSFDRYDVLLVPLSGGGHRLLWREGVSPTARAHDIGAGVFRSVLEECVAWLDAELAAPTMGEGAGAGPAGPVPRGAGGEADDAAARPSRKASAEEPDPAAGGDAPRNEK